MSPLRTKRANAEIIVTLKAAPATESAGAPERNAAPVAIGMWAAEKIKKWFDVDVVWPEEDM